MSPALLSPTLYLFEELLGFYRGLHNPSHSRKEDWKTSSFHHWKAVTHFSSPLHSINLFSSHPLSYSHSFFLSYPFSINLSSSFLTVVIFLSSPFPFSIIFMLVRSFFESMRSYWIFDRGLHNPSHSQERVKAPSLSSLLHTSILLSPAPILSVLPWHFPPCFHYVLYTICVSFLLLSFLLLSYPFSILPFLFLQ